MDEHSFDGAGEVGVRETVVFERRAVVVGLYQKLLSDFELDFLGRFVRF